MTGLLLACRGHDVWSGRDEDISQVIRYKEKAAVGLELPRVGAESQAPAAVS